MAEKTRKEGTTFTVKFNFREVERLFKAYGYNNKYLARKWVTKVFSDWGFEHDTYKRTEYYSPQKFSSSATKKIAEDVYGRCPWIVECAVCFYAKVGDGEATDYLEILRTYSPKEPLKKRNEPTEAQRQVWSRMAQGAERRNGKDKAAAILKLLEEGLTFKEIAKKTGVSAQTVHRYAKKNGILTPNMERYVSHEAGKKEKIIAYMKGNPEVRNKEIAEKFGISSGYVTYLRGEEGGVSTKKMKEALREKEREAVEKIKQGKLLDGEEIKQSIYLAFVQEKEINGEESFNKAAGNVSKITGRSVSALYAAACKDERILEMYQGIGKKKQLE